MTSDWETVTVDDLTSGQYFYLNFTLTADTTPVPPVACPPDEICNTANTEPPSHHQGLIRDESGIIICPAFHPECISLAISKVCDTTPSLVLGIIFLYMFVSLLFMIGLNKYFLDTTVHSAMIKVIRKVELAICNIAHPRGDDYDYYYNDYDTCESFRDQLEKFVNEASLLLSSKLPGQWQYERKWVAPAMEVLESSPQCKGMNFFFMKNHSSH